MTILETNTTLTVVGIKSFYFVGNACNRNTAIKNDLPIFKNTRPFDNNPELVKTNRNEGVDRNISHLRSNFFNKKVSNDLFT